MSVDVYGNGYTSGASITLFALLGWALSLTVHAYCLTSMESASESTPAEDGSQLAESVVDVVRKVGRFSFRT